MSETSIKKIAKAIPPYPFETYAHIVSPLSAEDGGGYLITFPDLPGCMSDGATPEEAIANGRDALKCVLLSMKEFGDPIPEPGASIAQASGKWVQRVPKTLHAKLAIRAVHEGVSLNSLVTALIAEGLGQRAGMAKRKAS